MNKEISFEKEFGGKKLTLSTGKFAKQADGAVMARYGDTVVLATVVLAKEGRDGVDYLPLTVDYEERMYASGKIKGSRFVKREGRPSEEAILTSRLIDRPLRPLLDENIRQDLQVIVTTLSYDGENDPDVVGIIAASSALSISKVPFRGPVGGVRVGRLDGKFVVNPTAEQITKSDLDLVVAGTKENVVMIEAGAKLVADEDMLEAIKFGHANIKDAIELQEQLVKECAKEKVTFEPIANEEVKKIVEEVVSARISEVLAIKEKTPRYALKDELLKLCQEKTKEKFPEESFGAIVAKYFEEILATEVRKNILEKGVRIDGRKLDEVRPITVEVGILPRTHGTGLFRRGETQVMTVTTLGAPSDEQTIDGMEEEYKKRYMHHYNFPPFSVGEAGRVKGPSRRDIGHGALAERALEPVLPSKDEFPYTLRLVSEVLEANGSTSMASTCGSSLSLMDAGVPIKSQIAGIAMGLVMGENGKYEILTDIQGEEDHLGDMDFKVTGNAGAVTAMQMDIKVDGITFDVMKEALERAKEGRTFILGKMNDVIKEPKTSLSPFAPKIITIKINPEKIAEVIGSGGKIINKIIETTGVDSIDIEEDGTVFISGGGNSKADEAVKTIRNIARDPEIGEMLHGKVTRIMDFGALVEMWPGREGMVHISELAPYRVNRVEDIIKEGDEVDVIVKDYDSETGKTSLSKTLADTKLGKKVEKPKDYVENSSRGFGSRPRTNQNGRRPFFKKR